jgi:hypothetical protein
VLVIDSTGSDMLAVYRVVVDLTTANRVERRQRASIGDVGKGVCMTIRRQAGSDLTTRLHLRSTGLIGLEFISIGRRYDGIKLTDFCGHCTILVSPLSRRRRSPSSVMRSSSA